MFGSSGGDGCDGCDGATGARGRRGGVASSPIAPSRGSIVRGAHLRRCRRRRVRRDRDARGGGRVRSRGARTPRGRLCGRRRRGRRGRRARIARAARGSGNFSHRLVPRLLLRRRVEPRGGRGRGRSWRELTWWWRERAERGGHGTLRRGERQRVGERAELAREDVPRRLSGSRVHHHRRHRRHRLRIRARHRALHRRELLLLDHHRAHRRVLRRTHAAQRGCAHRRLLRLHEPRRLLLRLTLRAYRRRHRRDRIVRGEPGVGVAGGWRVAAAAPRGRIPRPAHRSRSHSRELSAGRLTRSREMMMCRVRAETVRARRMSPASLRAPRGARMIGGGGG